MARISAVVKRTLSIAAISIVAASSVSAYAQGNWPTKPVTIIVPFAAGGSTDVVGRLLGRELGKLWGQTVIVENRAGAGGNIGAVAVAKAPADGYTILLASGSIFTVNPFIYEKLPFDPQKDFVPVTNVASGPMVVVVPANSPVKDLRDLIAQAKAKPGVLNFGSAGTGSQVHMAGEKFAYAAKVQIQHVPYKGEAPAYTDLMAGQTSLMVGNIGAASVLVNDGRLRALAVTGKERSKMLPNVPTVAEAGLPEAENTGWFGLLAPAGTPKDIIDKIQKDTAKALAVPELQTRLAGLGMVAVGNKPAEFASAIEQEAKSWGAIVKARGLKAN